MPVLRTRLLRQIVAAFLALVIAGMFFVPLLSVVKMAFTADGGFSFASFIKILTSARQYHVIANTLIINIASSLLAATLGVSAAYCIAYTNLPNKKWLHRALLLPLLIPGYIITLAWMQFFAKGGVVASSLRLIFPAISMPNIYSFGGIIFVFAVTKYPIIYTLTLSTFRKIPVDLELAAAVSGCNRRQIFRKVTLPVSMSGLANGVLLVFLSCLDNFGTVAFLGIPAHITVMTTDIYQSVISMSGNSFADASAKSVVLGLIGVAASVLAWRCAGRFVTLQTETEDMNSRILLSRKKARLIQLIMLAGILLINFVPLLTLIQTSLLRAFGLPPTPENMTLENYAFLFSNQKCINAVFNSIILAIVTAIICLIIGTIAAYLLVRCPGHFSRALDFMISIPYSIPGIILGLALILTWAKPLPFIGKTIYGTIFMLLLSYVIRFTALQIRSSSAAILQVDASMEEAGRVNGAHGLRLWFKILLPLIAPGCVSGMGLVFLSTLTELTTSSLLWSAGSETIGVVIYNYTSAGQTTVACAFSVAILIIIGLLAGVQALLSYLIRYKKEEE
ncbi:ABC transporter permease [Yanshouia hominis]|uniref:Iron ABC transporter permease n=1 Tax=Yanshouia hominis TaxID=2763673 RepID=A0ABR7NLK6_9FIRM|nr:iron ABC transporter permease [Yanshouia hominis]MBC8577269.1 iron ABC transporter permease [Yanshouia hominis]